MEDEPHVRILARRILEAAGFGVIEAESAASALEIARQEHEGIDVLLTDLLLAGTSGRDLADRVRSLKPDLAVAFMSGYAEETFEPDGARVTTEVHVAKPFTPVSLRDVVRRALDSRPRAA